MIRTIAFFVVLAVAGIASSAPPEVTAIRCPNDGLQPQVAVDGAGRIHLVYLKGDPGASDIFYARSDDKGLTWVPAIRVNSQPGAAIAAGTVRGAQLALGKNDRPHVAWMGSSIATPKGPSDATPMLYARLSDTADAFEPQRNVIAKHPGLDGGGSIAADATGNVFVAWHGSGDVKGEESRRVYVAKSADDGKTFAAETPMMPEATGVCGCCAMKLALWPGAGTPVALYRGMSANGRDMYLSVMSPTGEGRVHHLTEWRTKTCPMSTAAITPRERGLVLAWEATGQIMLSATNDPANPPADPISPSGKAGSRRHPSVSVSPAGVLLAWDEGTAWKRGGAAHWQLFDAELKPVAGASGSAKGLPAWSHPAAIAVGDRFVVLY